MTEVGGGRAAAEFFYGVAAPEKTEEERMSELEELRAENERLKAEIERVKEALRIKEVHTRPCDFRTYESASFYVCDCQIRPIVDALEISDRRLREGKL